MKIFYPNCPKVSLVPPTGKSGDQNICANCCRPITISLQFNKMFEKILFDKVYYYLQECISLLSKYQFGFKPKSATAYAVESIYSNLLVNADNGLYSCSIFLELLFDKFYNSGIRRIPLQLFRSHLSDCKRFVEVENVQSSLGDNSNGLSHKNIWTDGEYGKVDNWRRSNKLSLNYSKSTLMRTKYFKDNSNLSETSFQIIT